jgi:hypothetical protein
VRGGLAAVLGEDTVDSLVSSLLAADMAAVQQGRRHVAHVSPSPVVGGAPSGMLAPAGLLGEL